MNIFHRFGGRDLVTALGKDPIEKCRRPKKEGTTNEPLAELHST